MRSADEVLKSSLAAFRELQPPLLFETFQQTRLYDLKRKIIEIQTSQERHKSMTDFSRIMSFIKAFDGFAETSRLTAEQTSCVWGPVKYVLDMVKGDMKALDEILHSYRGLGTRIPFVVPYTTLVTEKPDVSICLAFMYQDLLQFQKDLLKFFTPHDWKLTFHTNWKYYNQESFPDILKNFDHHRQALEDLLRAHHYQKSNEHHQISSDMSRRLNNHFQNYQDDRQTLEMHIRRYEEDREKLLRNAKEQERSRKEKQLSDFTKWVSAPRDLQDSSHRIFADTRAKFPGTTDWIVKSGIAENWIHGEPPETSLLCLNGKKGAGKTILASRIIDHCVKHRTDFKTSFFYCREDDPKQNNILAVYKSLLIQMLVHHEDLLPSCYERKLKGSEMLNDERVARVLIDLFCNEKMNQFIIIDGVDEIEIAQRKPLLLFFSALVDKCDAYKLGKVRVMFLGHDLADYKQCMKSATIVQLERDVIEKDIALFVAERAKQLKEKFGLTNEELQYAQELTINRSDGMFLFASLAMDNLIEQPTVQFLKKQLRKDFFPDDLRAAYNKIIDRLRRDLGENQWLMARKIFGWLACAKRPLSWHEIQAVLSMLTNESDSSVVMDYRNRKLRDDIRVICGSLVQKLGNRIMFAHSTAKLHIVNTEHLEAKSIECDFTITCLRYLSSQCFRKDLNGDQLKTFTQQGYYAFQDYALSKWGYHLEAVIKAGPGLLGHSMYFLSQAISQFASVYRGELSVPADAEERTSRAREECSHFANYDFHEKLVTIWAHFSHQQMAHFKERNKLSIPSLATSLGKIRTILESPGIQKNQTTGEDIPIEELYGKSLFKCNRLTCDYFYEGFETKDARDNHLRRHDRPYHCPVLGCSVVVFGFLTNKDLDKHIRTYHPDDTSPATFRQEPREFVEEARFSCPECGRTFTRKANRDAHVRSKYGERPYACSVCPRAFTRANDLRRHVRDIHSRRRL